MVTNARGRSDLLLIAPLALFLFGMVLVPLVIAVLSSFGLTTGGTRAAGPFYTERLPRLFRPCTIEPSGSLVHVQGDHGHYPDLDSAGP